MRMMAPTKCTSLIVAFVAFLFVCMPCVPGSCQVRRSEQPKKEIPIGGDHGNKLSSFLRLSSVLRDREHRRELARDSQSTHDASGGATCVPLTRKSLTGGGKVIGHFSPSHRDTSTTVFAGLATEQGARPYQEDRILARSLELPAGTSTYLAVYDGHGGDAVSSYLLRHYHNSIGHESNESDSIPKAMKESAAKVDSRLLTLLGPNAVHTGSTANVVIISPNGDMHISNTGDSRSILGRNGKPFMLSVDHKPDMPSERSRVEEAGGAVLRRKVFLSEEDFIFGPWRVFYRLTEGGLATSRAFGDGYLKLNMTVNKPASAASVEKVGPVLTASPDVRMVHLGVGDEFVVLASDGMWDVISNEETVTLVRENYERWLCGGGEQFGPKATANMLVQMALERGSRDNVSAVVAYLVKL